MKYNNYNIQLLSILLFLMIASKFSIAQISLTDGYLGTTITSGTTGGISSGTDNSKIGSGLSTGSSSVIGSGSSSKWTGIGTGKVTFNTCIWDSYDFVAECMSEITKVDGYEFFIDDETGRLMYGDPSNTCNATELSCIQFCNSYATDNVISAGAILLTNENEIDDNLRENFEIDDVQNPFETGELGKWGIKSTYTYKTDITTINDDVDHSYEAGILKDFQFFDWYNNSYNDGTNWLNTNNVSFYSVDGKPLEEKNLMDVTNVAKYGYNHNANYLVAYNTEYESVLFESFEYDYSSSKCGGAQYRCFEEMGVNTTENSVSSSVAHSGTHSVQVEFGSVSSGSKYSTFFTYEAELPLFDDHTVSTASQLKQKGFIVKIWVKSSGSWPTIKLEENSGSSLFNTVEFEEVARSGEWKLYQAKVASSDWNFSSLTKGSTSMGSGGSTFKSSYTFGVSIVFDVTAIKASNLPDIYVDDIKMQPMDARMAGYVYDPNTLLLITQFSDQHFGTYYQYNAEGKLTRVFMETEKGIKTVKEAQYNRPTTTNVEMGESSSSSSSSITKGTGSLGLGSDITLSSTIITKNSLELNLDKYYLDEGLLIDKYLKYQIKETIYDVTIDIWGRVLDKYFEYALQTYINDEASSISIQTFFDSYIKNKAIYSSVTYTALNTMITNYKTYSTTSMLNTLKL